MDNPVEIFYTLLCLGGMLVFSLYVMFMSMIMNLYLATAKSFEQNKIMSFNNFFKPFSLLLNRKIKLKYTFFPYLAVDKKIVKERDFIVSVIRYFSVLMLLMVLFIYFMFVPVMYNLQPQADFIILKIAFIVLVISLSAIAFYFYVFVRISKSFYEKNFLKKDVTKKPK